MLLLLWFPYNICVVQFLHCKITCTLPTILARLIIEPFVTFSLTISLATACVTRNVPWNTIKYNRKDSIFSCLISGKCPLFDLFQSGCKYMFTCTLKKIQIIIGRWGVLSRNLWRFSKLSWETWWPNGWFTGLWIEWSGFKLWSGSWYSWRRLWLIFLTLQRLSPLRCTK